MSNSAPDMLVTCALPYANGELHLGHLLEHIQADIWVRFWRMTGRTCHFTSGIDAHGTPVMLSAEKQGLTPEELVSKMQAKHVKDFQDFLIDYQVYPSTHEDDNRTLAHEIYRTLQSNDDIGVKTIEQAFDPEKQVFLPDRYIKGQCPKCKAEDQYGDNCEVCGATYEPLDLINPKSVLSGASPITKESEHYFFHLEKYTEFLRTWTHSNKLQPEITNKLNEWLTSGLKPWDISRDAPYFGFEIPEAPGKYFYVWLDAPIGYISSFKKLSENVDGLDHTRFWSENSDTELYHFIGKDIAYFHCLFWPAVLSGAKLRTPSAVFAHGYLTVDGKKMSKSRGTFIKARTYLDHLGAEYVRYYFAAKLGSGVQDIDFGLEDFMQRVNSDLIGKVVNIASRSASFINRNFDNTLAAEIPNPKLWEDAINAGDAIRALYETREFGQAMRRIMELADEINQYFDSQKPWALLKNETEHQNIHQICTLTLNLFRVIMTYLKPVVPDLAKQTETLLNCADLTWDNRKTLLLDHKIETFRPLMQRIEQKNMNKLLQATQAEAEQTAAPETQSPTASDIAPIADTIQFDDFAKLDLRVAKILSVESIPEADKLLKLQLELGNETRQVFAGIKKAYPNPDELVGKLTVMVANLAPRKMRFGISEGMLILAAGTNKDKLYLLEPESGATPGMRVA